MDESKILIIGANGQLGNELKSKYPGGLAVDREELDITDNNQLQAYDWTKVNTIINAAAYTNVDGAETDDGRRLAWQINATAVGYLTQIAKKHNLVFVQISTEYVFDGKNKIHNEDEPLTPLGVYAQSKAAGEVAALVNESTYVLRTSWLIGEGPNFVRTMIGLADKNISPSVVSDQIGRPTFTSTLVEGIDYLLRNQAPFGIYNLSNEGDPISWADFTREIFKQIGRSDLKVTDTTTQEYFASKDGVAPRPLNSVFDLKKINSAGFKPSVWTSELQKYLERNKK